MQLVSFGNPSDLTWNYLYLGITVLGIVLIGAKLLGLPLFRNINGLLIAGLVVSTYGVTGLLHWYDLKR